jgi:hypothetical protein
MILHYPASAMVRPPSLVNQDGVFYIFGAAC